MKNTKKLLISFIIALIIFNLSNNTSLFSNEIKTQDVNVLPKTAQDFIKKYFSNEKIFYIEVDKEIFEKNYEVKFESGTEIDFTKNGNWKDIDCKQNAIPDDIIPSNILNYVKQNYKNLFITKIETKSKKYDIELSNNIDLEFDKKGNFIRIDD